MNAVEPQSVQPPPVRPAKPATLVPAILCGLALIGLRAFEWNLMEWAGPFLAPLAALPVLLFFAGVALAALVEAVSGLWRREFRRTLPLAVCLGSLSVAVFVPWTPIMLDVDFRLNQRAREAVARQVLNGELSPDPRFTQGVLKLPPRHRRLSSGGEVHLGFNSVLFYTFRGVLDSFSGYVYSPSDTEPAFGDFGGDFKEIRRLRKHWFWVSSS